MDFCIADNIDVFEKDVIFSRNLVTFINFIAFEKAYLNYYKYNDLDFYKSGVFSLNSREDIHYLSFLDENDLKIR